MYHIGGQPTVKSVMLSGLILKPWCTIMEQGDITRPTVVSTEPSETVKE